MAESIATGCAANLLSEGLIWLFKKVVAPVKVLICLPRAVTQMERDVENVVNDKNVIEEELRGEQQRAKLRVSTWLETAETLRVSSRSIREMYDAHQQHKSYLGCCPKCLCRYRISKDIRNLNRSLAQLHSQTAHPDFPSSGQYGDPTPRTQIPTPRTQIPIPITETGIVADAKRSEQRELAVRWLTDESSNVQRIGIIGMGGVGKTFLLDAINNSERVKCSFELIIRVVVSRNDISFLQNYVAETLNLSLPENSVERVDTLRNFFKNKRYVILLDDMWLADSWMPDKLQELGVSFSDTGSKFVITTRDEQVCAMMNVQKTIKVKPLSEEQGWELFRRKAFVNQNGNVPYDIIIEPVARRIAKECKGLPLAITVLGAAMVHHTELYQWEAALEQLQNAPERFGGLYPTVDTQLFQRLRWSYNVLSEDLQICFLSLAAYPEDAVIYCEELIDMWIAESVVKGSGESYLHDIGDSYLDHLRSRCLIEVVDMDDVGRIESVKIHDILRDLAVRIAKEKEPSYYFKAGQGMINFPSEEDVSKGKGCAKLSIMRNNLQSLPTTFRCSPLSVLLLGGNPDIKEVPGSFLNELPSLRILDLSKTGITSLPPSIGNLKHLASLQLRHTGISELPESIGDLKELQFLSVSFCFLLRCLPERVCELRRLRALDIRGCQSLIHVPSGISQLALLERLQIGYSGIAFDFEEANTKRNEVFLKDLHGLSHLRVFSAHIKSPVKEGVMSLWSKMRQLDLDFEDANQASLPQDMREMKDLESLCLWECDMERLPSCITQFRKLQYLSLNGCQQLRELPPELPYLRVLRINQCHKLEELDLGIGFPKLQEVTLFRLKALECVGPVGAASGSGGLGEGPSQLPPMLNSLRVYDCPKLKRLRGRWDYLTHLEYIKGEREWWDAIQWDDPNLKTLLQNKFK